MLETNSTRTTSKAFVALLLTGFILWALLEPILPLLSLPSFAQGTFGATAEPESAEAKGWHDMDVAARKAMSEGRMEEAQSLWEQAIKDAESKGMMGPGVINCLCGLSLLNHKRKNYPESERLYELAMRNAEGAFGGTSTKFADLMPDLAWLYCSHGRNDQAEILFKRALSIKEAAYGADDSRVADSLNTYAKFLRATGRTMEAQDLEERARSITVKKQQ